MSTHQPRLQTLAKLVPTLTPSLHKGDCGRIAVIGGCQEYTGAPYFAAHASLRLGTDIAYVICDRDAALAIKSYAPDLIVLPYLQSSRTENIKKLADEAEDNFGPFLKKAHAVSVGSGLGKNLLMLECAKRAIASAKANNTPIVLDADSLDIVCKHPDIISGYPNAVLTPNPPEFVRLCKALGIDPEAVESKDPAAKVHDAARLLAQKLGGVTVVRKGSSDVITNGDRVFVCEEAGGLRRCGGQGDILSGATVTFLAWGERYKLARENQSADKKKQHAAAASDGIDPKDIPMLASYAACMLTRHASYLAYDECGRSTQSSNILEQVDISFDNKFEEVLKTIQPN
ncbi:hypothetical protein GGI25_005922 [Coemansia spiralis]|uniref:ATP-dependent (S)-NAD(P)H-hydrate dehydratase n=2 Tax=Coemansia TaxID=4863 RepID=A0A9W8KVS6_9FUNG|nr:YjeF domain-containing protein [Coemansia spiralis]KAJ1987243.1 hypothetical protein EDC05_005941 [Coemansia umbellata]KAJ2619172.1 hypothetical protein GGI26_006046 [Coemansia sp. RSA 1358]KAJ2670202.1 hypothetical protein GGI25_005922 [Coemansia spiralis]